MNDYNGQSLIIPVVATRCLSITGGQLVEQAIPEEYLLASIIMRALELRDGRDLEFVLKVYLPVKLVRHACDTPQFSMVDLLGLQSAKYNTISDTMIRSLQEVQNDTTKEDLPSIIDMVISSLRSIQKTSSDVLVPGLLSGPMATSISVLFDWPTSTQIEPYSIMLPTLKRKDEVEQIVAPLAYVQRQVAELEAILDRLGVGLESKLRSYLKEQESIVNGRLQRLNERVSKLDNEIERLESRLYALRKTGSVQRENTEVQDINAQIEARQTARRRDLEQIRLYETEFSSLSESILGKIRDLQSEVAATKTYLESVRASINSVTVDGGSCQFNSNTLLLLPFVIVGYSKKGLLEIMAIGVSHLVDEPVGTSRRRGADWIVPLSEQTRLLSMLLERRIQEDVSLMKYLRDESARHNLLALSNTRKMIENGVKLLVERGLLKNTAVEQLNSLFSRIREISSTQPISSSPVFSAGEPLCSIRVHVTDEDGMPISNATVTIGGVVAKSDDNGDVVFSIPKSHYEMMVVADGFREARLDIELRMAGDVTVPISLHRLSREEQIEHVISQLEMKAERIESIRQRLSVVFEKQGETLMRVPEYRRALIELLTEIGEDPDVWLVEASRKGGMLKRLLRGDDRHGVIRRKILQISHESKSSGGRLLMSDVLRRLNDVGVNVLMDELKDVLTEMVREGLVHGILTDENGARVVVFIPTDKTGDPERILEVAARHGGSVSFEELVIELGWDQARLKDSLEFLIAKGTVREEKSYSRGIIYWFPGIKNKAKRS